MSKESQHERYQKHHAYADRHAREKWLESANAILRWWSVCNALEVIEQTREAYSVTVQVLFDISSKVLEALRHCCHVASEVSIVLYCLVTTPEVVIRLSCWLGWQNGEWNNMRICGSRVYCSVEFGPCVLVSGSILCVKLVPVTSWIGCWIRTRAGACAHPLSRYSCEVLFDSHHVLD